MVVKVYGPVMASCPQRVMVCLIEKGVEFEIINVDLEAGEQKRPEFLLRQPFGQVPAIEDGDFRLYESRAIVRYYAAKYVDQGTNLLGKTLEERALVDQWLEVEAHTFNDLGFNLVFNIVILPRLGKQGDLAVVDECQRKLGKVLDVYEEQLSKTKYLTGDTFTLADLSHMPGIQKLVVEAGLGHFITERGKVNAWWKDISSRPSWKKLLTLVKD